MNVTKDELYKQLEIIQNWVSNVDVKASIIIGIVGIFFGIIGTNNELQKNLFKSLKPIKDIANVDFSIILSIFFLICYILIAYFLFQILSSLLKVLIGRINPDVYEEEGLETSSLIFFGSIAKKRFKNYKDCVTDGNDNSQKNDLLSQIFINSKICDKKFKYYNKAIQNFKILLIIIIVTLLLLAIYTYL